MVEMTVDDFFEDEEDDFFAEAFRSVSEIESSSVNSNLSVISQKDSAVKDENSYRFIPICDSNKLNQSISESSCSIISLKHEDKSDLLKKSNDIDQNITQNYLRSENIIYNILNSDTSKCEKLADVNHRFIPGFTPNAKKRKFVGPAGMCCEESSIQTHHLKSSSDVEPVSKKLFAEDAEFSNLSSSQLSTEELSQTVSWKKLQEDVSSNQCLLSTAKLYSIQRVLNDTAKKKLPKHTVVPVLCVYLKKFCSKEPISIYMDDTGEISGKIDKKVLELYGGCIKSGTAFVLKKITFVCNVMVLEISNLVSIYLNDGTVKYIQDLDSAFEKETIINMLNSVCPTTPDLKMKSTVTEQLKNTPILKQRLSTLNESKSLHKTPPLQTIKSNIFNPKKTEDIVLKSHNAEFTDSSAAKKDIEVVNMDEFDLLLGNLDEKSFLEEFD